jgi:asparagine synthase (glutamine-hydrolysing)
MSGIVGLWNLDDAPADEDIFCRMTATLRRRGPDGERRVVVGSIGIGHHHLRVTPEEAGEHQPLLDTSGIVLAMDGRLDNRDELLACLSLSPSTSDAACVLAAYRRWQESFAERLNGDFALALFDPKTQQLLLARDPIGIRTLYYHRTSRLFAFASEIKALLAHPDVPTCPDDDGLADYLLIDARPLDRQETTCFSGISSVVPAHLIRATRQAVEVRRYWDFDTGRTVRFGSFDEYADGFRHHFREAVRRRARSNRPIAVSVSGGLDSSSILSQAETLRRDGALSTSRIHGISYTGAEGTAADERAYLEDLERTYGIVIERFPIEPFIGATIGQGEQVRIVEAPFTDSMWGVTRELHRRAHGSGSRVLLSGHWGDEVLFSSAYLVDLFRGFAWATIRRHLREYRRWFGRAEVRVLARRFVVDLVRHQLPRAFVPPLKRIRRRLSKRRRTCFSDRFLAHALRFADRPASIGEGFHSAQARALYLEIRSKYHVHCMEWNNRVSASYGLDAASPFLDRDLLAYLMAVPGDVQCRDGVPRSLLREGLRGVLPDAIRARTWKADFSPVANEGVRKDWSAILQALSSDSAGVRLGYLDAERLRMEVADLCGQLDGPECTASWDLADLYGLEMWFQVFLRDRSAATVPACRLQESVG